MIHTYAPCWLVGSVFSCPGLICRAFSLHRTSTEGEGGEKRGRREEREERREGGKDLEL